MPIKHEPPIRRHQTYERAVAIGIALGELMAEQGVSQMEIARRLNTDQGRISRHLAGKHDMAVSLLDAWARALGTTAARVESDADHVMTRSEYGLVKVA